MSKQTIVVGKDGSLRGIYSPLVASLAQSVGQPDVRRASHVDPTGDLSQAALAYIYNHMGDGNKFVDYLPNHIAMGCEAYIPRPEAAGLWWADMLPVGHGVLGPWSPADRDKALAAEVAFLQEHHIPTGDLFPPAR